VAGSGYTVSVSQKGLISWVFMLSLVMAGDACLWCGETAPQAAPIVRAVEDRYRNAKTLKAVFLESYRNARDTQQVESGTVYFSRPGRMRWEYEAPQAKLFVADGKTVWFFVPADHTVTRSPMKESADWRTPLALLMGKAKLSSLCDRIDLAPGLPATTGHVTLSCQPRGEGKKPASASSAAIGGDAALATPDQPFDEVLLEVDRATGELADVRVLQPGGIELDYRFGNWVENLPLDESLFHFDAPPGVAIVDESAAHP
jgi:outer membrane lipoprotein carrier protein